MQSPQGYCYHALRPDERPCASRCSAPVGAFTQVVNWTRRVLCFVFALGIAQLCVAQESVRFAAIGDYGTADANAAAVAELVAGWDPDFVVTMGDNRYSTAGNYDQSTGQFYCAYLTGVSGGPACPSGAAPVNAFFPSPGNHDYDDAGGIDEYLAYFDLPGPGAASSHTSGTELYYDVIVGPVHLFVIDSTPVRVTPGGPAVQAQVDWLQTVLGASLAAWQVVVMHHPPFSSSDDHGSQPALQYPYAAWGADVVLAGHDHTYERLVRDGILYFVNGTGGRRLGNPGEPVFGSAAMFSDEFGAMIIDANPAEMTFSFYSVSSPTSDPVDTFTIEQVPGGPQIADVQVRRDADDAEESAADGNVSLDSSDLELVRDTSLGADQAVGIRFTDVHVPAGAAIISAYIEFAVDEIDSGATSLEVHAEAADNAAMFQELPYDISSRDLTDASVLWTKIAAWVNVDDRHRTPDLAPLVREVMDRTGWAAGNAIAFVFSGSGKRTARSFDGNTRLAPVLHIEYDATDSDGDGIADLRDNCVVFANALQVDADSDDIGNACDPDFGPIEPGDCRVNFLDLSLMTAHFFTDNLRYDLTGFATGDPDGMVNFVDVMRMTELFFLDFTDPMQNPSGRSNECRP